MLSTFQRVCAAKQVEQELTEMKAKATGTEMAKAETETSSLT